MIVDVIIGVAFWAVVIAWYLRRRRRRAEAQQASSACQPSAGVSSNNSLDIIRFDYIDAEGDYSQRRVVVHQVDGIRFSGQCMSCHDRRTFRVDRVQGDITSELTGEVSQPHVWARAQSHSNALTRSLLTVPTPVGEVLFSGFPDVDRAYLEQLAQAHNWVVRQTVSKHLTVLVAGPRVGATKLARARAAGVQIMARDDFERICQ